MKKISLLGIKRNKYRKFKNPKLLYIFNKTLVFSITCEECGRMIKKYLRNKNHLRY